MNTNKRPYPNIFLVGAPKCGTTSLYNYLGQHPEIFLSKVKEPNYFNKENKIHYQKRTKEEYLSLFSVANECKYIGEGTTQYLISKNTPARIKEFNKSEPVKIIIALRRPFDIIKSVYTQLYFAGHELSSTFENALNNCRRDTSGFSEEELQILENKFYYKIPLFSQHIENYINVFGRENIHFVLFDDLKLAPLKTINEICAFLALNPLKQLNTPILNAGTKPRNIWLKRFVVKPPENLKTIVKKIIPSKKIRQKLYVSVNYLNAQKHIKGDSVPVELERKVGQHFVEEVNKQSILIGRDLSGWS